MSAYEELLKKYKEAPMPTGITTTISNHPLYWIMIRMIQLGTFERLRAVQAWTGLDERTIEILFNVADAENSVFPLSLGLQNKTRERIVQISPHSLEEFRIAAWNVSPEDMPPENIKLLVQGDVEMVRTELFFQSLRMLEQNPISKLMAVFQATLGLDDTSELFNEEGELHGFTVQTPQTQLLIVPVAGTLENGYYAARGDILDARAMAQEQASHLYDLDHTRSVVVSLGFTPSAQKVCLFEPKVLLMSLWAFLSLMECLQLITNKTAGPRAFAHIDKLLHEQGPGRFHEDGFVIRTIDEFLKPTYF